MSPAAGEQDEASPRVFAGGGVKCGRRGLALGIEEGSPRVFVGLGRIEQADTYRPTYSIFTKLIKNRILFGYVSITYRTRIRIGYVSDTGYGTSLAYPCYIGPKPKQAISICSSDFRACLVVAVAISIVAGNRVGTKAQASTKEF